MSELLFVKHEKELNEFQEWLKSKPHLPQNNGKTDFTNATFFPNISFIYHNKLQRNIIISIIYIYSSYRKAVVVAIPQRMRLRC